MTMTGVLSSGRAREQEKEMTRQVAADILDDDDRRDWLKTVVRAWMAVPEKAWAGNSLLHTSSFH